jgi:hypothetical protein
VIVIVESALEVSLARRFVAACAHHAGDAPDSFRNPHIVMLPAISGHRRPSAANVVTEVDAMPHDRLMTYSETALSLQISQRSVGRLVAAGVLQRRGRRITAESVHQYADGRS